MEDHRTERAARLADLLLAVLRFIVLIIIVPSAVLLATYYITGPVISDMYHRTLISFAVGVMLAGLLLNRIDYRYLGATAILTSTSILCYTFFLSFLSTASVLLGIHIFLIITLAVSIDLRRNAVISEEVWGNLQKLFGSLIVFSGPVFVYIIMVSRIPLLESLFWSILSLCGYLILTQIILRDKRIGSVVTFTFSADIGLLSSILASSISSDISFHVSLFSVVTGLGLLFASRALRRIQLRIISRITITPSISINKTVIDEGNHEPLNADSDVELDPLHVKMENAEWVIDLNLSQSIAAFGLVLVAIGIPMVFLTLTSATSWGLVSEFFALFMPLGILLSLLILMPVPVYLRLGGFLRRSREGIVVRILGTAVVSITSASLYLWTQFYLFPLSISLLISSISFIAGVTGLFKRVRRIFRRIWDGFTHAFKRLKLWVKSHILISGMIFNILFTAIVVYLIYPLLAAYDYSILGLLSVSGGIFSGIGTLGVSAISRLRNQSKLLNLGVIAFLASVSSLTLWYLIGIQVMSLGEALPIALLWMLLSSSIQKNGVTLKRTAIPYLPGMIAGIWFAWNIQITYLPAYSPILILIAAFILPVPVGHPIYSRIGRVVHEKLTNFGMWVSSGARYVGGKIKFGAIRIGLVISNGLKLVATNVKNGVTKAGRAAYDAAVVAAQVLLKFIFVSWAVFSALLCLSFGYGVVVPYFGLSLVSTALLLSCCFFVLYLGMLLKIDRSSLILTKVSIVGLSISLGGLIYNSFIPPNPITRLIVAVLGSISLLILGRGRFSDRVENTLPGTGFTLLLALVCNELFFFFLPTLGLNYSVLVSLSVLGILTSGYHFFGISRKILSGMYFSLTVISATLLTYLFTFNILSTLCVLVLAPIPYTYQIYLQGLITAGSTILNGLKKVYRFMDLHAVPVLGLVSFSLTAYLASITYLALFEMGLNIILISSLYLSIFTFIWLPILHIRKTDYSSLLSAVYFIFAASISFNLVSVLNVSDPIFEILAWVSFFSLFSFIGTSEIHLTETFVPGFIATLVTVSLLGIYIIPIDFVSKVLLLAIETILLGAIFVPAEQRMAVGFTSVVSLTLGVVFWNLIPLGLDPILLLIGFFSLETFILSIPERLRSSYTWWVFSSTVGIGIWYVLQAYGLIAVIFAAIISSELIRVTPSINVDVSKLALAFIGIRSSLLSIGTLLFLYPINIILSIQVAVLVFLFISGVSAWQRMDELLLVAVIYAITVSSSLSIFTFLLNISSLPFGLALYVSAIPILLVLFDTSLVDNYHSISWGLLGGVIASLVSSLWILTETSSSPAIFLTTWLTTFLFTQVRPYGKDLKTGVPVQSLVISSIVWLESIWITLTITTFPLHGVIAGAAGISLLSISALPLKVLNWRYFSHIWEIQAVIVAILVSAYLTNWNYLLFVEPTNITLTTGVILVMMSLLSAPVFMKYEEKLRIHTKSTASHFMILPGLAGSSLLAYFGSSILQWNPTSGLFGSIAVLCIGTGLYYLLLPVQPSWMPSVLNLGLSSSLAGIFLFAGFQFDPISYFIWTFAFWYILSIPTLIDPTIRFMNFSINILRSNSLLLVSLTSPLVGISVALSTYGTIPIGLVLGLEIRSIVGIVSTSFLITGLLYLLANKLMSSENGIRLRVPSGVCFTFGIYQGILYILLPENLTDGMFLSYVISGVILATSLVSIPIFSMNQLDSMKRGAHWLVSFSLIPFVTSGSYLFTTINGVYSIVAGILAGLIVMSPLIPNQIQRFINIVKNLGAIMGQLLRDFTGTLRYLFDRFGYIMWSLSSSVFTTTIAILSFPFFSDLIQMPPTGALYLVPSITLPMTILGMMLLVIAIIRRQVKTTFGSVSLFLMSLGLGITGASWLTEQGDIVLAGALGVLAFSMAGLIAIVEAEKSTVWRSIFWTPIPAALGTVLLDRLMVGAITIDLQVFAVSISLLAICCLYTISTYLDYLPRRISNPLWIVQAISLGVAVYIASLFAAFSTVSAGYLSLIATSVVLIPVIGKDSKFVFLSLFFFGLTGFAYTFVFGIFIQSLLLALAVSLLFFAFFVREREKENPRLVYLRLVVLLALVASIVIFGGSIVISLIA
ncbi:MAG: hypothetical protein GF411_01265 [Candidatus Lokiarchaeota archaeon]|nr:hypothetical protein [Candidatus Lokiarchaeota archaeon]